MTILRIDSFCYLQNSLRAIFDGLRAEMKRLEDTVKSSQTTEATSEEDKPICVHISEYLSARIDLIDLYPL